MELLTRSIFCSIALKRFSSSRKIRDSLELLLFMNWEISNQSRICRLLEERSLDFKA
jgi:hypothetical protein